MEKRLMFLAIAFLSAIVLVIAAYSSIPDPGHGADNVYIFINGSSMNLQDAITNSLFRNCSVTGGQYSSQIVHGHSGNEILVNVNGSVKTLQQAINDKALIKADAGKSPASYSTNLGLVQYQTANKIRITNKSGIEKNLQASINAGELKCVPDVITPPVEGPKYSCDIDRNPCTYAVVCLETSVDGWGGWIEFYWNGYLTTACMHNRNCWESYCENKNNFTYQGYKYWKGDLTYSDSGYTSAEWMYEIYRQAV